MIYLDKLKSIREEKELSQKELAKILNISIYTFSHYENEQDIMPIKHINTLCNYLNVSIDYFFSLTNTANYNNSKENIDKERSGNRLKEFRKENKLTQAKIAKKLNISRTTITEYERGNNLIATPFLYTICKTYKISADYLLGKVNEPKYLK